ncbi:hypothetical protein [Thermoflexus sp.]|uniref:hypothetical protein n=1 Tax=Thermoflexus sp. TaxID=1969742 RepID=UPI001776E571|nr:hypothetical protein [Thermoflexus sp.]
MGADDRNWTEDERRLREGLRWLARAWTSSHRDLWPMIRHRLSEVHAPERRWGSLRALPHWRPALLITALLGSLLVGIALGAGWTPIRSM